MCCRYYVPTDSSAYYIRKLLDELYRKGCPYATGEVAPGSSAPVLANSRRMEPSAFTMSWGYHLPGGKLVFNTRSETAAQKPMFADGMKQRRCLVPAAEYFEWEKTEKGKTKYAIAPEGAEGFFLAGIYRMEEGSPVFSVLTRSAAEDIAFIHDRMPVIFPLEAEADWLNPAYDAGELLEHAVTKMTWRPA